MLKQLLKRLKLDTQHTISKPPSLELAAGVLFVEVMRSDHEFDQQEEAQIKTALTKLFHYSFEQAETLLQEAKVASDNANDWQTYTQQIHQHFDRQQKFELLCQLWQVAFADTQIKGIEEYSIRRMSELLYMPHSEFIRAKIQARDNQPPA